MSIEERDKQAYELMIKNNPDEVVKNLILKDKYEDEILGLETERDVLKSEVKSLKADKKYYQEQYECLYNRKIEALDFCYRYLQLDLEEFDVYELFKIIIKILKGEE